MGSSPLAERSQQTNRRSGLWLSR